MYDLDFTDVPFSDELPSLFNTIVTVNRFVVSLSDDEKQQLEEKLQDHLEAERFCDELHRMRHSKLAGQ